MSNDYSRSNPEWVSYRVAHGILIENDTVLLAANEWIKGEKPTWTLPGGRAEPGEGLQETLVREFREETGLDVIPGPLAYVAEARSAERNYLFLTLAFEITRLGGELSCAADSNVVELRFVPLDQLEQYIPQPSLGAALRHWVANREDRGRYWYFPEYATE